MNNDPVIDKRGWKDIVDQAKALASIYTPEWKPQGDDPGLVLIFLFSRSMEIVIDRLNRVPEKNFLTFLDVAEITPLAPKAAQVPVRFIISAGAKDEGFAPQGTQLATSTPSGQGPVTFETEKVIDLNAGEAEVMIEPGMAIDKKGQKIIIDKNEPFDLTGYAGKAVYLVIAHKEQKSDPSTQKEATGNTRINEYFLTDLYEAENLPFGWDKGLKLILARITFNPGSPESDAAVNNIDYSEVTEAGVKVGEMKVPGIIFTVEDHGPGEWPGIKGIEVTEPGTRLQGIRIDSKKTTFTGPFSIENDLKFESKAFGEKIGLNKIIHSRENKING